MDGAGVLTTVNVAGMPFSKALNVKTGAISPSANPWDIRPRCFSTSAAQQNDVVVASFWMRAIAAPNNLGLTTFVVERNASPYTKSITFTAAANSEWKKVEIPFQMAEAYAPGGYNLSFWVVFPNQEIQIGGFTLLDYGQNVPYSQLGLTAWPYEGHEDNAPWRAVAAQRIERIRKGDIVVVVRDENGKPVPNGPVHVKMKRHAFGFGTAIAADPLQRADADGQNYRAAIKRLFSKTVTENALKWPTFEANGRTQADFMLPWFAGNGITMVRGHNVIWPGLTYLPRDVQNMLAAKPVDQAALRKRIYDHIADVMTYAKGKVTEWDILNEAYTNKDLQAALGDAEMALWFRKAREADPSVKLYINDYDILEAGGYNLPHIDGYYRIIQDILAAGGPIDGIGLQSHFNANLTPPSRVLELLDKFSAFKKELQVTEFDVNVPDEQLQADYTRDFMTTCFSHPAVNGFMIWGFWEGAHWLPKAAMIRRDWTTRPNYDVWNDLIFRQWWTDVRGVTGADGAFRTRGFLGDYDIEITANGATQILPLTLKSNTQPAYTSVGKPPASSIAPQGVVNAASFQTGPVAPGEIVTVYGSGFGPPQLAVADAPLPPSIGETRVLFDGVPAQMVYSMDGQVSAVTPYSLSGSTNIQVEYQGLASPAMTLPVAAAAPGIFLCGNRPDLALLINGGRISCDGDFIPPTPGDAVTLFATGMGAPALPWTVAFGGVAAPPCAAMFAGLIYPGVTQLNVCVPDGVPRAASVPVSVTSGGVSGPSAGVDLQPAWRVIWSDEFNGPAGASIDSAKWAFDTGGGGWGNRELETYTSSTENVFQDGKGNLVIRALQTGPGAYTSGRIKTQGKFDFQYGKAEARMRIPYGQGIWPAFWMLGNDIATAGWPACGEIDIMENIGREPSTLHGTVHGPGYSGNAGIGGPFTVAGRLSDDFRVYGVEWSPQSIAFFLDGTKFFEVTPDKLPAGKTWVYRHPFFLLLNVAVGGAWPGNPDATTVFPQQMLVDWVRVSQRQ